MQREGGQVSDCDQSFIAWRKSTASGSSNCIEVAAAGGAVHVRHSANPDGPKLKVSAAAWSAFLVYLHENDVGHSR
jgi:hypothetical protein